MSESLSRRALVRWAPVGLLSAVLGVVLLFALAHTPWVQDEIGRWATSRFQPYGLSIRVGRLRYNLLARRVRVEDLSVAVSAAPQEPFFQARAIEVVLPWSIFQGVLSSIDSLELDGARVSLTRRADGTSNWPSPSGDSTGPASPLSFGRLVARDLGLSWRDETTDARADVQGAAFDLEPGPLGATGRVTLAQPVRVRWQGRDLTIGAAANVAWNGTRLTLGSVRVELPEAVLDASGSLDLLADAPALSVSGEGRVDLEPALRTFGAADVPSGTVTFKGSLTGPLDKPRAELSLASSDVAWGGLTGVSVDAALRLDGRGVEADRFEARIAGASVHAQGRGSFEEPAGRIAITWTGADADRIATAVRGKMPVRFAAVADGRGEASWTAWTAQSVNGWVDVTVRPEGAGPQRVAMRGTAKLSARDGEWQAAIDQQIDGALQVAGELGGRLSSAALGTSTLTGRATAAADAPARLWALLQKFGLPPNDRTASMAGRASADFSLAGTLADPSAEGALTVTDGRYGGVGPVTMNAVLRASRHELEVTGLDARLGANVFRASGSASFDGDRISGELDAMLPEVGEIWREMPASLQLAGGLQLSATVAGRASSPEVEGRIEGQGISFSGQRIDRLEAHFSATPQTAVVERLELTREDGRVVASGTYAIGSGGFTGTVTARNVALEPAAAADGAVSVPVSGRGDLDLSASGTFDNPRAEGRVALQQVRWADRELGSVAGELTVENHRLETSLRLPDLFLAGSVGLSLQPFGAFLVDARAADADLSQLASRLNLSTRAPLRGTTSLTAHVEGELDRLAESKAVLDIERFDATVGDIPVRLVRPGHSTYDEMGVTAADLLLDVGRCELRVAGQLDRTGQGTLTTTLDGTLGDLVQVARGLGRSGEEPARLDLDGSFHFEARTTGTVERPQIGASVRVDGGRLGLSELPPLTDVTVQAALADGVLDVTQLNTSWQGATLSATSRMPLAVVAGQLPEWAAHVLSPAAGPGRLRARFDALTPAVLAPWLSAETLSQLAGAVSGTLNIEATTPTLAALTGELVLDRADLSVAGVKLDAQRPPRIAFEQGRVRVVDWEFGAEGNRMAFGGDIGLETPRPLNLSANGQVDLRVLGAFLPNVRTGGRATLTAHATGTIDAPQFDGRIDLQGGAVRMASPQLIVSDLQGSVLMTRTEITVSQLRGSANGGSLEIGGAIQYSGVTPTDGRLTITGRGLAMAIPPPLKTGVNADLALGFDRGRLSLTGEVTVAGGSYREAMSLAGGLLQSLQPSTAVVQLNAPEPSALDQMSLDVRIVTAEDIQVNNNYAQLAVGADVRLRGTVAQPVLVGRAEAREGGRIFLGGNVYQLRGAGSIDFLNPTRIEPDFNITAVTRVGQEEITMALRGTPARLQPTLTSTNPTLGQADIISLLVTGRAQSGTGAIPSVGSDRLVAYLAGEFLGVASRAVGLDTLRIEPNSNVRFDAGLIAGETNPGSRLTFGKQVTRTVELVFSQNMSKTGEYTWIAAYRPRSAIEIRLISKETNDRIYDFRHDLTLGGPSVAARAPAPQPRINAVRIAGEPGELEPDLRRRLSLDEGKRFDFFRWQRDRDKLEQFLQERGHLEGQVVTRRTDSATASGRLDLEYDVHPGPRTIVDLPDIAQAAEIRKAVEAVWTETPFDAFLIDESVKATRVAMVRAGYLRATVAGAVESRNGASEKHLVLTIMLGERTGRARIVFSGNQNIASERLEALVGEQHLDDAAWIDPAPLERAVSAFYRDEGFLAASVKAGEPVVEGNFGTLPVTIDEGREFVIERVDFPGVKSLPLDDISARSGLKPGMRVTRAAFERAFEAIGTHYRNEGFTSVVVAVKGLEQDNGAVTLSVSVDEGPRQILQEIEIRGAQRTRPSLVSRALRLNIGTPVDPSAFTRARRRLYDSGVFRLVDLESVPVNPAQEPGAAEQPVKARLTLEEWAPIRVRYGFELDDEHQPASEGRTIRPGVAGDFTYRNLFGRAWQTGIAARLTSDFRAVRWFATAPTFFGLPITSNIFIGRFNRRFGIEGSAEGLIDLPSVTIENVSDAYSFTAEQRVRVRGRLQAAYSFNFEHNRTYDAHPDPDDPIPFDLTVDVGKITTTELFDSRDDLIDATRGILLSSTFEYGVELATDARFVKQFVQQTYYRNLGRSRMVLATSARVGLAYGFESTLIPSERFFAGGGNSVRGYLENSLGPRTFLGDPTGGNAMLVLNEELRFPIAWRFRGVGFFDAGNVFETVSDFSLSGLQTSVGFGLRVQTPVALLRLDLGVPLGRLDPAIQPNNPWNVGPFRLFFSIGQVF